MPKVLATFATSQAPDKPAAVKGKPMSAMWHYSEPENGILRVEIESVDRPVNALSRAALEELSELIKTIRNSTSITGVLFASRKPGNFIAGADVSELKDLTGEDAARGISQFGQMVFQELEDLKTPTVALIAGACLGGGLEFAMACRYRIAADDRKTLLGLPEVKLGLIPGWGGTVRLPRLIGFTAALPLILTGKSLNGFQARSRGLVHDVVPREALDSVGEKILKTLQDERDPAKAEAKLFRPRKRPLLQRVMDANTLVQRFVLRQAAKQVLQKSHGHYPAPLTAIDTLRASIGVTEDRAFVSESKSVASLAVNPVTAECIRLFFLQEDAKKPPASATVTVAPDSIKEAAVIGAGAMGAGIALLLAKRGVFTRLKDLKPDFVANGMRTVRGLLNKDVKRRRLTRLEATDALDHLSPTTDYRGLKHADVVIEAVLEDLDIKRQVFRELAAATGPKTVLATNTSSLRVEDIARDIPHPERIVGLHFFNPPHQMPLIEVIRTEHTSPAALAKVLALVQRIGKTNVVVGDCTGFLVNRLLSPYMNEAGFLLTEVADPLEIERAAIDFGMPMGPLELTDLVGVDVAAHVAANMHTAYGDRMKPAPLWLALQELRSEGQTGKIKLFEKTKRGKQLSPPVSRAIERMRSGHQQVSRISRETIIQRLIYPIINEAALCLSEGIAARPEDVDLAMVFGTGFAPFRGGPLRYADSIGINKIVDTLSEFATNHPHLAPSVPLRKLAENKAGFFTVKQDKLSSAVA